MASGAEVARVDLDWGLYDVAFSPDSNWLATANLRARVYDVSLGRRQLQISGYSTDDARRGRDLLGLDRDVDALATLIAPAPWCRLSPSGSSATGARARASSCAVCARAWPSSPADARDSGELQRDSPATSRSSRSSSTRGTTPRGIFGPASSSISSTTFGSTLPGRGGVTGRGGPAPAVAERDRRRATARPERREGTSRLRRRWSEAGSHERGRARTRARQPADEGPAEHAPPLSRVR